ncbi:MAG TPA: isoamylase early set domain-containing protein [Phycisphaerae bacterium]|nr:isoamylase early set domain-containing protein [Phycisphaerae bacterium]
MIVQGGKDGTVTFICRPAGPAGKVYLVGDFNRWDPTKKRMVRARDGSFRARVALPPGNYEYKFVIDGLWGNDPDAACQAANAFGTCNSVANVPSSISRPGGGVRTGPSGEDR